MILFSSFREDSWNPENIVTVKDTLKMGLIEEIEENTGKQCDSKVFK